MKAWKRRTYEIAALAAARKVRVMYLFWTRRGRKSTTLGSMAFDAMSAQSGQSVIAASASLLVGSELVSMTLSATENAIRIRQEAEALRSALQHSCDGAAGALQLVHAASDTGKVYKSLTDDDYTDLYRSKRLEFRLYFTKTQYSRLLVIAPNPATARGWGGWVFRDEQMFTQPALERDLQTATNPIIDTDPTFRMIYASNLCGDDRHPGYEMTVPREPMEFTPNPQGHFYQSQTGILVHRVDLADAYSAGHTLYSKAGQPMDLDTALAVMSVQERKLNYMLVHEASGTAAIDAMALATAQQRGLGLCNSIYVDSDADFAAALAWLRDHLRYAPTGVGFDVATTTKAKSNPSSVTVTQQIAGEYVSVLNAIWKTRDAKVARERCRRIVETCIASGAKPRRLCIDGSNELYFANETQTEFRGIVPVQVVRNGETVDPIPAGYESAPNFKTYLGDLYTSQVNDNHFVLPPQYYLKKDHRSVFKDRGTYDAEVDADGAHGDTFDSGKLSLFAFLAAADPGVPVVQQQTPGYSESRRDRSVCV
jgi:hypothetical protein